MKISRYILVATIGIGVSSFLNAAAGGQIKVIADCDALPYAHTNVEACRVGGILDCQMLKPNKHGSEAERTVIFPVNTTSEYDIHGPDFNAGRAFKGCIARNGDTVKIVKTKAVAGNDLCVCKVERPAAIGAAR